MDKIVKKLMESHRLDEMAIDRNKAIDKCTSLGKRFVEHFDKVYKGGIEDIDFSHHCDELQTWYNDVKNIVLKHNHKKLSRVQLMDWFFTVGSTTEELFPGLDGEIDMYEKFIIQLLHTDDSIEEIISSLFEEEEDGD